ncbi:MAG: hypothetical protein CSA95_08845 [Bacteroidetes bacterium]|nr:MAG: hypothetical protein CSA95_08845 [Bacteroidota bacterium]
MSGNVWEWCEDRWQSQHSLPPFSLPVIIGC